jgi:hypothetical protein
MKAKTGNTNVKFKTDNTKSLKMDVTRVYVKRNSGTETEHTLRY